MVEADLINPLEADIRLKLLLIKKNRRKLNRMKTNAKTSTHTVRIIITSAKPLQTQNNLNHLQNRNIYYEDQQQMPINMMVQQSQPINNLSD